MLQLFLLLQVFSSQSSDSTFQSLERITPVSFLSFDNPIILSFVILLMILMVSYIYYRYIVIPMKKKHLEEEENIRLQQAELMALFAELSPDVIFRFGSSGRITLANNSAHKIFPQAGMLGENVNNILPEVKSYDLSEIISKGKKIEFTSKIDDRFYQFILEGVPKVEIGQIFGRDITDLKNQQVKLGEALKKAEVAKDLKADFLARISHEIRMPLAAIQGFSQLITNELAPQMDEDYQDMFRSIENNSKRLYRTIDLILNMSQIQTGDYEPRFEDINIIPLLNKQYKEFDSLAVEKDIKFSFNSNINKDAFVHADYYSIEQMMVHLIGNAFKFTSSGEVSINLREENGMVCVDIKDTGIGISEGYMNKMFTPFTQEKMGYTRPFDGTGLGLALVKSFADMNNSSISVKSKTNEGSTFTVTFGGTNKL